MEVTKATLAASPSFREFGATTLDGHPKVARSVQSPFKVIWPSLSSPASTWHTLPKGLSPLCLQMKKELPLLILVQVPGVQVPPVPQSALEVHAPPGVGPPTQALPQVALELHEAPGV